MWYQEGEEKAFESRMCPMPVPIICLEMQLRHCTIMEKESNKI